MNVEPNAPETMPSSKVFDSWVLLAWLLDQPAAAQAAVLLQQADDGEIRLVMSWMNIGEVYYMAVRKAGLAKADEFLAGVSSMPIQLVTPSPADFIEAAKLKSTRRISYADAFAAALARKENAALVTGDPELRQLTDVLSIEWIGVASS